jgi:Zn-dependent protease with chaperone function
VSSEIGDPLPSTHCRLHSRSAVQARSTEHTVRRRAVKVISLTILLLWTIPSLRALADEVANAEGASSSNATALLGWDGPVAVPEPSPLAVAHHRSGNWLWGIGQAWALLVPAVWLISGASASLRTLAQRLGRVWFGTIAVYALLYISMNFLLNLPLDYYYGFVRPHAYGLSNQTHAKWLHDALVRLGVSVLLGVSLLWIPYLLLQRSPCRWWIYVWLASVPVLFLLMMVAPVWFDPLFNRIGPMQDHRLEQKILALAQRAGIDASRVFEVAKSEDTKTVNAHVTGFWGTKRIVLWDTLLERYSDDEVLFVMGHEMGHFVLGHVVRSLVLLSVLLFVVLALVQLSARLLMRRWSRWFGFDTLADVASLPLLLLLLQAFSLAALPAAMAVSRSQEHAADRFALEMTGLSRDGALGFAKLMKDNLGIPRPGWFYTLFRASHPSLGSRIEFCNAYYSRRPRGEPDSSTHFHVESHESVQTETAQKPQTAPP